MARRMRHKINTDMTKLRKVKNKSTTTIKVCGTEMEEVQDSRYISLDSSIKQEISTRSAYVKFLEFTGNSESWAKNVSRHINIVEVKQRSWSWPGHVLWMNKTRHQTSTIRRKKEMQATGCLTTVTEEMADLEWS